MRTAFYRAITISVLLFCLFILFLEAAPAPVVQLVMMGLGGWQVGGWISKLGTWLQKRFWQ